MAHKGLWALIMSPYNPNGGEVADDIKQGADGRFVLAEPTTGFGASSNGVRFNKMRASAAVD